MILLVFKIFVVSVLCWFITDMAENFGECFSRWQTKFIFFFSLLLIFFLGVKHFLRGSLLNGISPINHFNPTPLQPQRHLLIRGRTNFGNIKTKPPWKNSVFFPLFLHSHLANAVCKKSLGYNRSVYNVIHEKEEEKTYLTVRQLCISSTGVTNETRESIIMTQ